MANVKITELTAYTNPDSTDVLPIVDVGADVTKKISIADLLENAGSGTAAAPGIAFDGDSNTGIYRPGADQVAISTNGTGRLFVDSSGRLLVGTSTGYTFRTASNVGISYSQLVGVGNDETASHAIVQCNQGGTPRGPSLILAKNRSGSSALGTVQDGENLGEISFQGSATSAFVRAANIQGFQDGGTPSSTSMAGRLVFSTTADGASAPTERLRIDSNGLATFAGNIATTGVVFGTPSAPATSNTLDDYEEGIWTPAITFSTPGDLSVTYTFQKGSYTKIGDTVTVLFRLTTTTFTHTTAAGALRITGLPFTASNTNPNYQGSAFSGFQGITNASFTQYSAIVLNNNSFLSCAKNGSGRGSTDLRPSDMPTGGTVILHGTVSYKAY